MERERESIVFGPQNKFGPQFYSFCNVIHVIRRPLFYVSVRFLTIPKLKQIVMRKAVQKSSNYECILFEFKSEPKFGNQTCKDLFIEF